MCVLCKSIRKRKHVKQVSNAMVLVLLMSCWWQCLMKHFPYCCMTTSACSKVDDKRHWQENTTFPGWEPLQSNPHELGCEFTYHSKPRTHFPQQHTSQQIYWVSGYHWSDDTCWVLKNVVIHWQATVAHKSVLGRGGEATTAKNKETPWYPIAVMMFAIKLQSSYIQANL